MTLTKNIALYFRFCIGSLRFKDCLLFNGLTHALVFRCSVCWFCWFFAEVSSYKLCLPLSWSLYHLDINFLLDTVHFYKVVVVYNIIFGKYAPKRKG